MIKEGTSGVVNKLKAIDPIKEGGPSNNQNGTHDQRHKGC